jgi:branched-chain amino acid transport system substrate-binding protein
MGAPFTREHARSNQMLRRTLLKGAAAAAVTGAPAVKTATGYAAETPGISATEIKIGNTVPYSGPASSYGVTARVEAAFFKMVNDQGGIAGRKINFVSLDDGYSPPRTVEQTRRLVEEDRVAFMFASIGTPTNTAVHKYLNQHKVPQLLILTGADKWGDYKHYPWTIGWLPSYRTEAQIYAKYILATKPNARLGILYQNDDFGKDYVVGVKDVLGNRFDKMVAKVATYEVTDPSIDSQIVSLQSAGVDALVVAAVPKFAAQAIRKIYDIGWKPLFFMTNVSVSVGTVIKPAGPEKAEGMITGNFAKDPTDAAWKQDPGMQEWRAFMRKYQPNADMSDILNVWGYGVCRTLMQVLKQCNGDFSRANIMRQVANLHDLDIPVLLPGININTSPTNFHPIRQMQLARWTGKTWQRFGGVIEGGGA